MSRSPSPPRWPPPSRDRLRPATSPARVMRDAGIQSNPAGRASPTPPGERSLVERSVTRTDALVDEAGQCAFDRGADARPQAIAQAGWPKPRASHAGRRRTVLRSCRLRWSATIGGDQSPICSPRLEPGHVGRVAQQVAVASAVRAHRSRRAVCARDAAANVAAMSTAPPSCADAAKAEARADA
jgi:hypothetical protein